MSSSSPPSPPPWQAAASKAARGHENQYRKDGATPYSAHTTRVALTLILRFGCRDEELVTAALLHDLIEDTGADYDEIEEQFGPRVAELVARMSKDMRLPESAREEAYDRQLAEGPWEARLIKLADVYDNYCDAASDEARRKIREKIQRALALAEGEPRLAEAAACVRSLLD